MRFSENDREVLIVSRKRKVARVESYDWVDGRGSASQVEVNERPSPWLGCAESGA